MYYFSKSVTWICLSWLVANGFTAHKHIQGHIALNTYSIILIKMNNSYSSIQLLLISCQICYNIYQNNRIIK